MSRVGNTNEILRHGLALCSANQRLGVHLADDGFVCAREDGQFLVDLQGLDKSTAAFRTKREVVQFLVSSYENRTRRPAFVLLEHAPGVFNNYRQWMYNYNPTFLNTQSNSRCILTTSWDF